MHTADTGNMYSCAYTTDRVRNFGPAEVDMKVAVRHPRDLVYLAKRLTPSLDGFQTRDVVEGNSTNNELLFP